MLCIKSLTRSPPFKVKDFRVSMHTRHEAQANGSPHSLCHLSLVDRTQTSVFVVLDSSHLGHIFRHHGKVL